MASGDDPMILYWKWLMTLPIPFRWPWEDFDKRETERKQIHVSFPFVVTIEATADDLHDLEKWCGREFGQKHGECDNNACWDNHPIEYVDSLFAHNTYDTDVEPVKSGKHRHIGTWTTVWALKTSYEDGFCDFCFKDSSDAVYFTLTFTDKKYK